MRKLTEFLADDEPELYELLSWDLPGRRPQHRRRHQAPASSASRGRRASLR